MKRSTPNTPLAEKIDERLAQSDHVEALQSRRGNWIRSTRHALGWVLSDLGEKLSMSKQALSRLEEREREGLITIRKLEQLAEAMHCQFVYGFIPIEPMATTAASLERRQEEARRRHRTMPHPS